MAPAAQAEPYGLKDFSNHTLDAAASGHPEQSTTAFSIPRNSDDPGIGAAILSGTYVTPLSPSDKRASHSGGGK
jgi:hypothetical protein